jgi:hypothetical protein
MLEIIIFTMALFMNGSEEISTDMIVVPSEQQCYELIGETAQMIKRTANEQNVEIYYSLHCDRYYVDGEKI